MSRLQQPVVFISQISFKFYDISLLFVDAICDAVHNIFTNNFLINKQTKGGLAF